MPLPAALVDALDAHGQSHVVAHAESLSADEAARLADALSAVDLPALAGAHRAALASLRAEPDEVIVPLPASAVVSRAAAEERAEEYRLEALRAVAAGRVCGVILAGGQGTRLGYDGPKGAFDLGLPSRKTLFQLLVERARRVAALADDALGVSGSRLPVYVMTSPINEAATRACFAEHGFFGMDPGDVFFFLQGVLPAVTEQGKLILETRSSLALAPDGNGGIYAALDKSGALLDMERRGVSFVHVLAVDNPLSCLGEPGFVGCCVARGVQAGNLCVPKARWDERVGVAALRNGRFHVVEYSEISEDMAKRAAATGDRLEFGAANICNHFFTLDFLRNVVVPGMRATHHAARKAVPCVDDPAPKAPNALKLELFIFDAFPLADRFLAFEAPRESTFAPVKNATGADSPATARAAVTRLHAQWLASAGVALAGHGDCEVSPLVSLAGEGLDLLFERGAVVTLPASIDVARGAALLPLSGSLGRSGRAGRSARGARDGDSADGSARSTPAPTTPGAWRVHLDLARSAAAAGGAAPLTYEVVPEFSVPSTAELVVRALDRVDLARVTPVEALFLLSELKEIASGRKVVGRC